MDGLMAMAMDMDMDTETSAQPSCTGSTIQQHQRAILEILEEFDRICTQNAIPYSLFAGTLLGAVRHKGFIPWDEDLDVLMLRRDYEKFLNVANEYLDRRRFFLQAEFSEHWPMFFSKLRMNGTACLERYHPNDPECHQGIYIDIFPCDDAADSELLRRWQFLCSKVVIAKSLYARGYTAGSWKKKLFLVFCRGLPLRTFLRVCQKSRPSSKYVHTFFAAAKSYGKNVLPREWVSEKTLMEFEGKLYPCFAHADALLTCLYGEYMTPPPENERKCKEHAILVDVNHSYEEYAHYRDGMTFDVLTRSIR